IVFAAYLARWVLAKDTGTEKMREVSDAIFDGAQAFLSRQYRTIATLAVVAAVVIGILLAFLAGLSGGEVGGLPPWQFALRAAISFLFGALCSGVAGYIGMNVAVRSNIRVASAAQRGVGDALLVSFRGGAVTGFLVIALSLLGVTLVYIVFGALLPVVPGVNPAISTTTSIVGFGFGASFVALFAQLGGGIYTKAADVGADLVGKVEAGIPEDDPRNPAVIADLVGDNVGDCAGRGADIFESTAAENIGAMILGASVALVLAHNVAESANPAWVIFPLVVVGLGIICSLIGTLVVRKSQAMEPANAGGRDPGDIAMGKMNQGYYVTSVLSAISIFVAAGLLLGSATDHWWVLGLCGLVGIVTSFAFVFLTQYYTAGSFRPVREIAEASKTGPATNIIAGLAVGFENTGLFVLVICGAIGLAYFLGSLIPGMGHVASNLISVGGIYGTAVATMGMLMSAAYILAMDTFGPITDNAGGIVEMSGAPDSVRVITDALDGVGNTTKALTKGYGIGSAALAAFLLFSAYLDIIQPHTAAKSVNLAIVPVFIAALIGAMLIFLFSSFAIRAVSSAAQAMIQEVRRQFRANPKIMQGTEPPDYARCVDISARSALRQMVVPGLLVVGTPILVGLILGPEAAAGLLMVGTIGGIMMALVMNNGGGAWDNAKKYIEAGYLKG
ncbi:MAG TPA: sodium-translocating pyrophosphatase, partial [Ktedonobacterales bacterium]|nr:sodium-translocating pyrophosphatase [Ktedonobacterales bacterium]